MSSLTLRADHHDLRRLHAWLASWLDPGKVARVELCVHEIAANAIDHAGATGLILSGTATSTDVEIVMTDDGGPYVDRGLDAHPRVRGYGQMIADQLASTISYAREADRNQWRIRFESMADDQSASASTSSTMEASSRAKAAETPDMALRMNRKSRSPNLITVNGRLDSIEAAPLRSKINDHLASGNNRIAVDLSEVDFLDSAGLAALVIGMKRARLEQGDLRIVTPRRPEARRVFELTKFDEVFVMAGSLDELFAEWHDV